MEKEHSTSLIPLHDELIKQNTADIKEIKNVTNGLPQTIERIEYILTQLNSTMDRFIQEADKKYQSKEMCQMCSIDAEKKMDEVNKRVDGLEKKYDYLYKGLIAVLITVVGFGLKIGIDVIQHALMTVAK